MIDFSVIKDRVVVKANSYSYIPRLSVCYSGKVFALVECYPSSIGLVGDIIPPSPSGLYSDLEVWLLRGYSPSVVKRNRWNIKFPGNEDFGSYGWSFKNIAQVVSKFPIFGGFWYEY